MQHFVNKPHTSSQISVLGIGSDRDDNISLSTLSTLSGVLSVLFFFYVFKQIRLYRFTSNDHFPKYNTMFCSKSRLFLSGTLNMSEIRLFVVCLLGERHLQILQGQWIPIQSHAIKRIVNRERLLQTNRIPRISTHCLGVRSRLGSGSRRRNYVVRRPTPQRCYGMGRRTGTPAAKRHRSP